MHTQTRGFTLIEIVIVLAMIGVLTAVALPFVRTSTDRGGAQGAALAMASMHSVAKNSAIQRGRQTALIYWPTDTSVYYYARNDAGTSWALLKTERIGRRFGASFTTTRTTLFFTPRGIGQEASGTTMIVRKGSYADTLTISAAGRLVR